MYDPVGAAVDVATVKVDVTVPLAAGVTDTGAKEQVTAGLTGFTEQLNTTAELNPLKEVTVIVEVVEFPAEVAAEAGEADKLKSFTVSATVVVRV